MTVRVWLVAVVALVPLGIGGCTGSTPPTVRVTLGKRSTVGPDFVVFRLRRECTQTTSRVRLDLTNGPDHLRHDFACPLPKDERKAEATLVQLVAGRHDATRRAERIASLRRAFGFPVDHQSELSQVWQIGIGKGCYRISDSRLHRKEILQADRGSPPYETPVQWTEVEAAYDAGRCPGHLDELFTSVAHAGFPAAANQVRAEFARIGAN